MTNIKLIDVRKDWEKIFATIKNNPGLELILIDNMHQSTFKAEPIGTAPWLMAGSDYFVDIAMEKANAYMKDKFGDDRKDLEENLFNEIFDVIIEKFEPKEGEFEYYVPQGRCHGCVSWLKAIAIMTYPAYRWIEVVTEKHSTVVGFNKAGKPVKIFDFCWSLVGTSVKDFIHLWAEHPYQFIGIKETGTFTFCIDEI